MSSPPPSEPHPHPGSGEWWPELGPRWEPTTAVKPPYPTIDIHSHVEVPEAAAVAAPHFRPEYDPRMAFQPEESTRYNRELRATQTAQFVDPAARIADMDLQGIDIQALAIVPPQYFYWLDAETGPRASAMQNDAIRAMVETQPDRFVGIANLPMDHPEAAIAEMARANSDLGFNGFEVNADVNGGDLDQTRFDPVWARAEELEMLVILHPHGWTEPRRMDDYYLINVVCMPLASTVAVSRMILGGVFERFPGLRVLVVHGGGYLPFYFARTDHAFRVRPETRRHIPRPPSEYLHKLYFDTTVFDPAAVEYLVGEFGADHVLMGTDYPFDMGPTDPLAFLAEARLTEEEHALIVGGNAARLLRI
ncbi:MAG TPA: amidohydrolase family protein [Acidimicrobiia bacterium]|nr:amidohydrolase family protein [Acidimicrobiia bacterium]